MALPEHFGIRVACRRLKRQLMHRIAEARGTLVVSAMHRRRFSRSSSDAYVF